MKQQLKMHKQALESALNSVVRLCVVAPTVNVHMGDQTLPYKAPLPQEKIRDFVELQVRVNSACDGVSRGHQFEVMPTHDVSGATKVCEDILATARRACAER
jgi:hypothetical protein